MKSQSRQVRRAHVNTLDNPAAEELFLHQCRDCNGCMNSPSIAAVLNIKPRTVLQTETSLPGWYHRLPWKGALSTLHSYWRVCMWHSGAKVRCSCKWVHTVPQHTVVSMCLQRSGWESLPVVRLLSRMHWKALTLTPVCHISPFSLGDITSNIKWQHKSNNFDPLFGIL